MSNPVDRVSLTISHDLVEEFDNIIEEWQYSSRSKAVRDALRMFIAEHRWQHELDQTVRGSIAVVYDHHTTGINDKLLELQHESFEIIIATQHIHFDEDVCLETMVVNGPGTEIRDLVHNIRALNGTKQIQFTPV